MKYLCANCNYVYDEIFWDETEWIKEGTTFHELGFDFLCPVCWEDKDTFNRINQEILSPGNYQRMTEIEAMHTPKVSINEDDLIVEVWFIEHPMVEWHYIYSVWLYDEYWDIVEETFLTEWSQSMCNFDISDFDEFEVRATCTEHWIWTSWMIEK